LLLSHIYTYCQTFTPYLLQIELDLISSLISPSYLTISPHLLFPFPPNSEKQPLLHHTPSQRGCYSSVPTRIKSELAISRCSPFTQCYFRYYNSSSSHIPLWSLLLPANTCREVWGQVCTLSLIAYGASSLNSSSIIASYRSRETSINQCHGKRIQSIFQNNGRELISPTLNHPFKVFCI